MHSGKSTAMWRRAHDVPLYPFFLDGAVLVEGLMQPDGIHPNARGVQVIVDRIAPLLANDPSKTEVDREFTGAVCCSA